MHSLESYYGETFGADWSHVPDLTLTIPALLEHTAKYFAEDELCVTDDRRITYGEACARSAILARQLLSAGIGKASRVGMIFPNGPDFAVAWLAITRIGAVAVPISTLSTAAELSRIIRHADLRMLISADRYLNHDYVERIQSALQLDNVPADPFFLAKAPYLRDIWIWGMPSAPWARSVDLTQPCAFTDEMLRATETEVSPADPACIVYSSGSTAEPKGVIHSHGAIMRQAAKMCATYAYRRGDRIFTQMPFFWVGGLVLNLLNAMHSGSAVICSDRSGSALLDVLEQERATFIIGWPHAMRALAADPTFAGRDFRFVRGGGLKEALPESLWPRNQVYGQALGMTETCAQHTLSLSELPDDLVGSFGPPMPGMEQKIVDVHTGAEVPEGEKGELLVRGDALMQGLVKREREAVFERDGWYRTHDLCSIRQGHLFFHGRCDDMIKSSGANVSPEEVEQALLSAPGVSQAIILGLPDEERGSIVGAVVVPQPGATLNVEQIRDHAARTLSSYKRPRRFLVLEPKEIPIASSGKVDRRALIAQMQRPTASDQ